jgi:putative oxidoreductase
VRTFPLERHTDALFLLARVLLSLLFILFGWQKLAGFSGTVGYMTSVGAPAPTVFAIVAVVMEFAVDIAIVLGFCTRLLALLLALYTLGAAFIGHHYWTMTGVEQYANMVNFYKNLSIIGGLLLITATGPGRYSLDRK